MSHRGHSGRSRAVTPRRLMHFPFAIPDSVVTADSLAAPVATTVAVTEHLDDSPTLTRAEAKGITTGVVPYTRGIAPRERAMLPGYDSGIACLLIGAFLLIAFNLRHYTTMLKSLPRDLFSVRRRDNLFEEHTMNETRLLLSMIVLLCLNVAIVATACVTAAKVAPPLSHIAMIIMFAAAMAAYYVAQLCAYSTVGVVFADADVSRLWLKGFNASQSTLGLALVIPALVVVFDPAAVAPVAIVAAVLYLIARMIFIYKGFRLFYHKISSFVYFILYLCTLEVAPLFLIVRAYRFIAL
ncbi:MAG: DUF4271 domain-containing protein [Duncaniella sp.]|nr:DUF4271 domain-containing protein [Duncaniella sp.]